MICVIGHHEPKMMTLLRGSRGVNIDGDVFVDALGPPEFVRWLRVLSNPVTFAWRSTVTGERHVQVCGSSTQDPVHGRVTVVLDGDRHRDLWDAVLEDDLRCGDETTIDLDRLLQLAQLARIPGERRSQTMPAA